MNPKGNDAVSRATAQPPAMRVKDYLEKAKGAIAQALPDHLNADRFLKTCLVSINTNPKLAECTLPSLLNCVMSSAQLGLSPGPLGHVFLIPYGNVATFQVGYKGLIELVTRTGEIEVINAMEVCEKDFLEYELGFNERLVFKPAEGDRGAVIKYLAYAKTKSGGKVFKVMTREEVTKHAKKYSKAYSQPNGPWTTAFDAMALKTCLLAVIKYLPKSVSVVLQNAAKKDSSVSVDDAFTIPAEDYEVEVPTPDNPVVMMDEKEPVQGIF